MVFSTLIPTLLHLFLAAVSFISIASFLRPPTLRLLEKAPEDKLAALGAPFMISLIVFATAAAAYALIWGIWLFAGDVIEGYLQGYIGLLRWIALAIGAF